MPTDRDAGVRAWRRGVRLAAAAFWLFDLLALRAGVPDPLDDSWEYGVVARSLLAGHGFRTAVIHPPLWSLRDAAGTVPVLVHGPLLPLLLAPLLRLVGPGLLDHVAWLAAAFAWLAAAATFELGAAVAPPPVAAAAAALLTLSPLAIRSVHHDVALTAGACLLAAALAALARERPRGLAAGLALGVGTLARPEFLWAAPVLLALARGSRLAFALAFAACVAPWAWHTAAAAGSPFFNLSAYLLVGYSNHWPGLSVLRDFALPPRAWPGTVAAARAWLPGKLAVNAPHALKRALSAPGGATGWLAPPGAAFALARPPARRLAAAALALAALPFAILCATLPDPRYLAPFLPAFALGAACGAAGIAGRLPAWLQRPRAWLGLLALLAIPNAGTALNDGWREGRANAARLAREVPALAALPRSAGGLVFSDTPDFVTWTTGRPAVWVVADEYARLPAWAGGAVAPYAFRDRPRRTPGDVTWFHAAEGRGAPLPRPAAAPGPAPTMAGPGAASRSPAAAPRP